VAVAETGHAAIERAAELHPDVMLVDLGLPDGISGETRDSG
jgi:DNA-binding NarL/FixJ family response regulator